MAHNNKEVSFCAPSTVRQHGGTCFDRAGLGRIIKQYNEKYPYSKIKYTSNTPVNALWNLIRNGLADVCGDQEWCWLDQDVYSLKLSLQFDDLHLSYT